MFFKNIIVFSCAVLIFSQPGFAQIKLSEILANADTQRQIYEEKLKNIFAEEKKTFRSFDSRGNPKQSYQIESNFLIYQSLKNAEVITEYRNVTKIDGRNLTDDQQKSEIFFNRLLHSKSVDEELERIRENSAKFDKELFVNDLTLRQCPVLAEHIRPYFDFEMISAEDGKYLIEYRQIKESPFVLVNDTRSTETKLTMDFGIVLPKAFQAINARVHGKLTIDARNFQIWSEERTLTIQPDSLNNPLTVFRVNFVYADEKQGIPVPHRISLVSYLLKLKKNELTALKDVELYFEYSQFGTLDVRVKTDGILTPLVVEKK